jgi:hypothetical protein
MTEAESAKAGSVPETAEEVEKKSACAVIAGKPRA